MFSICRSLILACVLSVMVVSPVQTLPTRSADPNEPNTILGRHYQVEKRSPLIIMPDPTLDSDLQKRTPLILMPDPTLDSALQTKPKAPPTPKTNKRPAPVPNVASSPKAKEMMQSSNTTTTNKVAARRLVPYPRYLAERAITKHVVEERAVEPQYLSHTLPSSHHLQFDSGGESVPERPSVPAMNEAFLSTSTSAFPSTRIPQATATTSGKKAQKKKTSSSKASTKKKSTKDHEPGY